MKKVQNPILPDNWQLTVQLHDDILKHPNIHRFATERVHMDYGISERTLERYFLQIYHMKYKDFLHGVVLTKAEFLIDGHKETLEEIACDLGYSDQYTLQTALRRKKEKMQ
jgi:AraC-like DNA-binding protein